MADKITCRLQTPADDNGERKDIHLITTSDEVICDPDSEYSVTLTEKLERMGSITISSTQPDYPCIWAKLSRVD